MGKKMKPSKHRKDSKSTHAPGGTLPHTGRKEQKSTHAPGGTFPNTGKKKQKSTHATGGTFPHTGKKKQKSTHAPGGTFPNTGKKKQKSTHATGGTLPHTGRKEQKSTHTPGGNYDPWSLKQVEGNGTESNPLMIDSNSHQGDMKRDGETFFTIETVKRELGESESGVDGLSEGLIDKIEIEEKEIEPISKITFDSDFSTYTKEQFEHFENVSKFAKKLGIENYGEDEKQNKMYLSIESLFDIIEDLEEYYEPPKDWTSDPICNHLPLLRKKKKCEGISYVKIYRRIESLIKFPKMFEKMVNSDNSIISKERVNLVPVPGCLYIVWSHVNELDKMERRNYHITLDISIEKNERPVIVSVLEEHYKISRYTLKNSIVELQLFEKVGYDEETKCYYPIGDFAFLHFVLPWKVADSKKKVFLQMPKKASGRINPLIKKRMIIAYKMSNLTPQLFMESEEAKEIYKVKGPSDTILTSMLAKETKRKIYKKDIHQLIMNEFLEPTEKIPFIKAVGYTLQKSPMYVFFLEIFFIVFRYLLSVGKLDGIGFIDTTFNIGGMLLTYIVVACPFFVNGPKYMFLGGILHSERTEEVQTFFLESIAKIIGIPVSAFLRDGDPAIENAIKKVNIHFNLNLLDFVCLWHIFGNISQKIKDYKKGVKNIETIKSLFYDLFESENLDVFQKKFSSFLKEVKILTCLEVSKYINTKKYNELKEIFLDKHNSTMQIGFQLKYFNHPIEGYNSVWSPLKKVGVSPLDAILFLKKRAFFCVKILLRSIIGNKFSRIEKEFLMFENYQELPPKEVLDIMFNGEKRTNDYYFQIATILPGVSSGINLPFSKPINKEFKFCEEKDFFFFESNFSFDLKKLAGFLGFDFNERKMEFDEIVSRSLKYMNTIGSVKRLEPNIMITFFTGENWYKCFFSHNSFKCEKCGIRFCPHLIVLVQMFGWEKCKKSLNGFAQNDIKLFSTDRAKSKKLNKMKNIMRKRDRKRNREYREVEEKKNEIKDFEQIHFIHPTTSESLLLEKENLERLKVPELKTLCKTYKIKNFSKKKKGELIDHLFYHLPNAIMTMHYNFSFDGKYKEFEKPNEMDTTDDGDIKFVNTNDENNTFNEREIVFEEKVEDNLNEIAEREIFFEEKVEERSKKFRKINSNKFLSCRDSIHLNRRLLDEKIFCNVCKKKIDSSENNVRCDIKECKNYCCYDCAISVGKDDTTVRTTCKMCFQTIVCGVCDLSLKNENLQNIDFCPECSLWCHKKCLNACCK